MSFDTCETKNTILRQLKNDDGPDNEVFPSTDDLNA